MSFLWHDYETFGTVPAVDRPCQFAAQRTDEALEPVGEPVVIYCAPANDVLPRPGACLVTGITPQLARREGRVEAVFADTIRGLMMQPGTCSAGYNSIRFDDEVTRNLLYRNLLDPYEREWKNGNSRWDLINLARMCYALRPQGIEWPMVESKNSNGAGESRPSFRLEDLAGANEIAHEEAHDALSDVLATIGLARRIREAQPKLFEWALSMRDKQAVRRLLDPEAGSPVVHTSGRISSARGCTSLVMPLARHPVNNKAVIVFDLMGNAEALVDCDSEQLRDRVFTPAADLPESIERLPLKAVKWNAVPMVAPANVLHGVDLDRIGLDLDRCERNADLLGRHRQTLDRAIRGAFDVDFGDARVDPDLAIYSGGFFSDSDRRIMQAIHDSTPTELAAKQWRFEDPRLPLMLLRYRARNWPDSLSSDDWQAWERDRLARLGQTSDQASDAVLGAGFYSADAFKADLREAREKNVANSNAGPVLDALEAWFEDLGLESHISDL